MGNIELTKHYLAMQPVQGKMPEVAYFDIIQALDSFFNGNWTWELAHQEFAMDNSQVATTVTLYTPAHIYTGRATCPVKEFGAAHLYALLEASKTFIQKSNNSNPAPQQGQPPVGNMTSEQIMNAINGNNGQIDSSAQFYNHKDEHNVQADSVPFDQMTNNANQQLQQEMGMGNAMNPPQPQTNPQNGQQNNDEYNKPQEKYNGYSQSQIDRIEEFKKQWDVVNNQMFSNYVNMWHNGWNKSNLNPQNIEEFLAWTKQLGK